MKNFASVIVLLFLSPAISAQSVEHGLEGGINFSFASIKGENVDNKSYPGLGFHLGGFADLPISDAISFHSQLIFSFQGFYQEPYPGNKGIVHILYLKNLLDVVYHSPWGNQKLFFGLGPFIGIGIIGTYNYTYISGFHPVRVSFGTDSLNDNLKRYDAGVNLLMGYRVTRQIFTTLRFDLGVLNELPDKHAKAYTRNIGITAAYVLKNKK